MPVEVSTCGAKSTAGFSRAIISSSSSIGHGAYCAVSPGLGPCGCALTMMCSDGMSHLVRVRDEGGVDAGEGQGPFPEPGQLQRGVARLEDVCSPVGEVRFELGAGLGLGLGLG